MYRVINIETGTTIMIASLSEIAEALNLHKDAVRRIKIELERDGFSLTYKRINFEIVAASKR